VAHPEVDNKTPFAFCMSNIGILRRYVPDGAILIWLSSENGSKAALCLDPIIDESINQ